MDQPQYSGCTGRQPSVSSLYEFEASLIYIAGSRPARARVRPCQKEEKRKKEKKEGRRKRRKNKKRRKKKRKGRRRRRRRMLNWTFVWIQ